MYPYVSDARAYAHLALGALGALGASGTRDPNALGGFESRGQPPHGDTLRASLSVAHGPCPMARVREVRKTPQAHAIGSLPTGSIKALRSIVVGISGASLSCITSRAAAQLRVRGRGVAEDGCHDATLMYACHPCCVCRARIPSDHSGVMYSVPQTRSCLYCSPMGASETRRGPPPCAHLC